MASRTLSETPSGRRPGARRTRAAWAGALATLVVGLALAAGPATPPRAPTAAPTLADCKNLLRQFDVAWPARRDSAHAANARRSRDLGASDCEGGRYVDGVHNLRRALHDIGVKPVKNVSPAPPR